MLNMIGLPSSTIKTHPVLPHIRQFRTSLIANITQIKDEAEKLNRMVYFISVPSMEELPENPSPQLIMTPVEYKLPELPVSGPIIFTYDPSKRPSLLNKIASFLPTK